MEKIIKRIHEILTDHKNRIIRLEKVPVPTYTAGAVLVGGANGLPTVDADLEYDAANDNLRTGTLTLGKGSTGSGDNTYVRIYRSADTGGTVSIDAFRSGIGGTTLKLNTVFGGPVEIAVQSWQTPTLLNSWINNGGGFSTAQYMKDPFGFTHLKGVITGGTSATDIFTLPVGYRPAENSIFPVMIFGNALGRCTVYSDGRVYATLASASGFFTLDGISFRAV